jgi:hypothetical protein
MTSINVIIPRAPGCGSASSSSLRRGGSDRCRRGPCRGRNGSSIVRPSRARVRESQRGPRALRELEGGPVMLVPRECLVVERPLDPEHPPRRASKARGQTRLLGLPKTCCATHRSAGLRARQRGAIIRRFCACPTVIGPRSAAPEPGAPSSGRGAPGASEHGHGALRAAGGRARRWPVAEHRRGQPQQGASKASASTSR